MTINDVKIIELPKFLDARGNLSFAENWQHIPFEIKRTYWIYDELLVFKVCMTASVFPTRHIIDPVGAFDVVVDDGDNKRMFTLNRSYFGLYVPAGLWRTMDNFSTNSFALEFGSEHYAKEDYIRDYGQFLKLKKDGEI